ncbi:MAG: tetratricopeptide repeat protein [Rivularia sp. (in: cyanobacteria)]
MLTINQAIELAIKDHRANRLTKAEQLYGQILKAQPKHLDALWGLGVLKSQLGQYKQAEEFLNQALLIQPKYFKAWLSLGNLHQYNGKLPQAVETYKQALTLQPDSVTIHNNLGCVLQAQGNLEEAITCFQKALEIQPSCTEAEVSLGNAFQAQRELSPAEQTHYASLNNKLGVSYKNAGNYNAAVAYFRQAIAIQATNWKAHYNLGLSLQALEELQDAIACYQKVLELHPTHPNAHFKLGEIYQTQKNVTEAIAAYQKGLSSINSHYSKAVETFPKSANTTEVIVTPDLPEGDMIVGTEKFPSVPPVSEDKRPFWSVVIPVYNRSEHLLKSLSSVLAQWTGEEQMEILVVDNASDVPLFDLVNSLGKGIVRYYRHPQNLGLVGNHNAAIFLSKGRWIHILHDDDYVLPNFYDRLQQSLENSAESIGAAFTGFENISPKGEVVSPGDIVLWYGQYRGVLQDWLMKIGITNPLRPPAMVVRRSTYEKLGGYHPELTDLQGWEMCKRIASFYDCWYEPEILAHYRVDASDFNTQKISNNLFLTGNHAVFLRRAIEISDSYFPTSHRAAITKEARRYNFRYLLERRVHIPLQAGRIYGALRMLEEALRIDSSPEAYKLLCAWLAQNQAAPLREVMISKLLSIPLDMIQTSINSEDNYLQTAIKAS